MEICVDEHNILALGIIGECCSLFEFQYERDYTQVVQSNFSATNGCRNLRSIDKNNSNEKTL